MKIILFRHSTAEKWSAKTDDFSRKLTEKGKLKAEKKARLLKKELLTCENIIVWSSPLTRAVQTARIICREITCRVMEQKEYIATGELERLVRDLQKLADDALVIITGHAPYLDIWCESISGTRIKLKKSGFVCIQLENLQPVRGTIRSIYNEE